MSAMRSAWESGVDHEPEVARLLPRHLPASDLPILDCGAGSATTLGKMLGGRRLPITAIDALADRYREMLTEIGLTSPVPSLAGKIELDIHAERDWLTVLLYKAQSATPAPEE